LALWCLEEKRQHRRVKNEHHALVQHTQAEHIAKLHSTQQHRGMEAAQVSGQGCRSSQSSAVVVLYVLRVLVQQGCGEVKEIVQREHMLGNRMVQSYTTTAAHQKSIELISAQYVTEYSTQD
jgi:hypothetical protein